jgi:hypothetical protein
MRLSSDLRRLLQSTFIPVAATVPLGGTYSFMTSRMQAADHSPADSNQEAMLEDGVLCLFCHTDVLKSPAGRFPVPRTAWDITWCLPRKIWRQAVGGLLDPRGTSRLAARGSVVSLRISHPLEAHGS